MKYMLRLLGSLATLLLSASVAAAETQYINRQVVNRQIDGGSSYLTIDSMRKQALVMAQEIAERSFRESTTTAIVVTVTGERDGQIVPILVLNVTRTQWQQSPDVNTWAKYSGGVKRLLGFDRSRVRPANLPITAANSNPIRDGLPEREANFYNQR